MSAFDFVAPNGEGSNDYYRRGFLTSIIGHFLLFITVFFKFGAGWGSFEQPVVYSVTIEGGKTLGGKIQVPKPDQKTAVAPPKNIKSDPKEEKVKTKESKTKEVKDPETNKNTVKIPDPKIDKKTPKEEKKTAKSKAETPEDINKKLQSAMQRYLGESSDAGGSTFGAATLGGKGMGGGVVRPPEFFIYLKKLEEFIKSGWIWNDTNSPLISQVTFDISPDGRLSSISLVKGSGNSEYDESVLRAINKASPVPPPPSSVYEYFRSVRMTFDPRE